MPKRDSNVLYYMQIAFHSFIIYKLNMNLTKIVCLN